MRNIFLKKRFYLLTLILVFAGSIFIASASATDKKPHPSSEELVKISSFLDLMGKYIEGTGKIYAIADNETRAASFAVMEIKTVYEDSGNPQGAIKELEALLQSTKDKTVRNVIRFQLLDLYKNHGKKDEAIANLISILNENL